VGRGLQRARNESVSATVSSGNHGCLLTVVALDERHLLCIFDRIPNGWTAVPKDTTETNSVLVVRLTLERERK
jgi:hypothetical protein